MKINIQNLSVLLKLLKPSLLVCIVILSLSGCKKDSAETNSNQLDGSTIKFVLNDNFNFGVTYGALNLAGLTDTLAKPGPYTFLAPDNNAFLLVGIREPVVRYTFQFYTVKQVANMMRYSILPGKLSFKSMPFVQNKPLLTATGGNVYFSKYLKGTDTVTTINGFKLASVDNAASNGLIQVLPQLLNAELYHKAMDYLRNDTTVTLFAAALHRANLDVSLLGGTDVYTLIAPSNTAFQQSAKLGLNLGISTLDSILKADPVRLASLLKYHIIKDRYFEGDLYRYASTNPSGIAAINGSRIGIGGDPAGFHAITFTGNNGIPAAIATPVTGYNPAVNNANIPCGNAVVFIINRVLIP